MNLNFPIITYLHGQFVVHEEFSFKLIGARFTQNKFITKENLIRPMEDGWIIDYDGNFIELKVLGKSREYLRPIIFLWNFVLNEYQVIGPKKITVGELKKILQKFPKKTLRKRQIAGFIAFLESQNESKNIEQEMLQLWPI